MSSKAKAFFSSLIAGVIFLAMFFFIVPLLFLILAVVGIAVLASMFSGRGSINITTIRITNTPHVNRGQDMKRVPPIVVHKMGSGLQEQDSDADITIYPDGSTSEAAPEENSREATKDA